jgi:hypothetical protein
LGRNVRRGLALWVALAVPELALACEPPPLAGGRRLEGAGHVGLLSAVPTTAGPFGVEVSLCARDGGVVGVPRLDAWMPAHRHGMNYRPVVTAVAPGRFRAGGFVLHMPGRWEFVVEAGRDRLTLAQDVE